MNPEFGEALTRWAARLAIACYVGRAILDWRAYGSIEVAAARVMARWIWSVGCGLYLLHVLCAFAFFHYWSHALAYQHIAAQTEAVVGIHWGGGLYVNYAFTAYWVIDTSLWWLVGLEFPYSRRTYIYALHLMFAFMVINATVVFGPPIWTWLAGAFAVAILLVRFYVRKNRFL